MSNMCVQTIALPVFQDVTTSQASPHDGESVTGLYDVSQIYLSSLSSISFSLPDIFPELQTNIMKCLIMIVP